MVDNQFGVASDQESSCPYFNHNSKPVDKGLIFHDVIGGVEMEANGITELMSLRQSEDDPRATSGLQIGTIKVHCPILWVLHQWWLLCHPFCDEDGEGLRLDHGSGNIADVESVEFKGPLCNASGRVAV